MTYLLINYNVEGDLIIEQKKKQFQPGVQKFILQTEQKKKLMN